MVLWRRTQSRNARGIALPAPPRHGMVGWYEPGLWLSTGVQVLVSTLLGQRFDYRIMEDTAGEQPVFDYSSWEQQRNESGNPPAFCFDYLADTGDGWNSTHAVASLVAQEELSLGATRLPRGRFLVVGGDEVYPCASKQSYAERLVAPFEAALPTTGLTGPEVFAVPGNHDWYDGLVSFSRLFTPGRWLGGWATVQSRSYFAIKLPYRWWLWAVDIQLESDIDLGQREYFSEVVGPRLRQGDRVILASAEPDWIYGDIRDPAVESNLAFLEEQIIEPRRAEVYVWVAGDLHHYRRHQQVDNPRRHRIVCGGGGAYLVPTHQSMFGPTGNISRRTVEVGQVRFEQQCAFPSPATSWRLSFLNLFFLLKNWRLGLLTGPVYAMATWLQPAEPIDLTAFLSDRVRLAWGIAVFVVASFFASRSGQGGRDGRAFRLVGGVVHAAAHIALALFIAYLSAGLCRDLQNPLHRLLGSFALNLLGGAVLGPILLGLYLLVGSNLFGAHMDEAFSALRIQDYKSFLRFRIQPDGSLEIFPVGLPRVPRHGDARAEYMLIEGPIVIPP
ncbi:MAG TPA: calcineurin [Methylomirabilota bacterium]|nr:calcineurin [Methylomirabilota bacterium]